ncbi:DUF397 domain-containing protein [Streptomyces sp. NPDC056465]|uniref:DUF397 domain-containing protein n=1 Tax=unclassified Streptomyces TaxID=2593676 RepID=UPI0035E2C79D
MSDRPAQHAPHPPRWRRSSRSTGMNNCVEAAELGGDQLAVRDSKDTGLPPLRFSAAAWTSFLTGLHGLPVS